MSDKPGYMRWTPEQWRPVAVGALERLNPEGSNLAAALKHGQRRALTKDRWRDDSGLKHLAMPSKASTQKYIKWAQSLTNDERAKYLAPIAPKVELGITPPPAVSVPTGSPLAASPGTWTKRECALIARRVRHWQVNLGDRRPLSSIVIAAQEIELPPDRRKGKQTIYASKTSGAISKWLKRGAENEWLIESVPFDAQQREYREPQAAAAAAPELTPEPASAPTSPAIPAAAPTPQATPQTALSGPAAAFGAALAAALVPALTPAIDALLAAHRRDVLAEVYGKLAAQGEALGATIANAVSADIVRGLRGVVHGMVESELGGPIAPPADAAPDATAPPAQHNPEPAPPEQPKPRLKVDIVGLNTGGQEQQIRQAFNGLSEGFRFISPDQTSSYSPHRDRVVLMMTQRIPHGLAHKIKASRAEVIQVRPTVGHVIHAIEALAQGLGVPLGAH